MGLVYDDKMEYDQAIECYQKALDAAKRSTFFRIEI